MLGQSRITRKVERYGVRDYRAQQGGSSLRRFVVEYALALLFVLSLLAILGIGSANAADMKTAKNPAVDTMLMLAAVPTAKASQLASIEYPSLFNTTETISHDISAFTKFADVMDRFRTEVKNGEAQNFKRWFENIAHLYDQPIEVRLRHVNSQINMITYKEDIDVWGVEDHWATPEEFFTKRAGDCEDYAIAKYIALKALGVPEHQMRLSIVHDKVNDTPHAILIVYNQGEAYILDNQLPQVTNMADITRYQPYYSISRLAWWRHTPIEQKTASLY